MRVMRDVLASGLVMTALALTGCGGEDPATEEVPTPALPETPTLEAEPEPDDTPPVAEPAPEPPAYVEPLVPTVSPERRQIEELLAESEMALTEGRLDHAAAALSALDDLELTEADQEQITSLQTQIETARTPAALPDSDAETPDTSDAAEVVPDLTK